MYYGGVTSWTDGECTTLPCLPIPLGVDFGMCDMALGIAMTDSGCVSLSGCGFIGSDGIDYSNAFYSSTYACNSQCLGDTTVVIACIDSSLINNTLDCASIYDPVCGCDGVTYNNACEATYYGGVTSFTAGACIEQAPPCTNVNGISFGMCDMFLGYTFNGTSCWVNMGCGYIVDNVDYSASFFPTMEECLSNCAVSVNELSHQLQVFPNPAKAFIQVNADLNGRKEMTILSISGKTVLHDNFIAKKKTIDISQLPTGVYFLRITTNDGTFTQRIIKE
jgi:hypothetical protein